MLAQVLANQGEYLPPEVDRQVGLGMLGLANLLRRVRSYIRCFRRALDRVNADITRDKPEDEIARKLEEGIEELANC